MADTLRIAIAQLNPTVGDLDGNVAKAGFTFTKADEGKKAALHNGQLRVEQPWPEGGRIVTIEHVDEDSTGKLTLVERGTEDRFVIDNLYRVKQEEESVLPYSEDVKCIEVEQILEGGVHARLPIDDVFFRRGAANTFNARKIVERLQHDLSSSAKSMSVGYVASMKLLDSEAMRELRKQTAEVRPSHASQPCP